jgi:hypothetical protein
LSLLQVTAAALIGATIGIGCVLRSLKDGKPPGEIAYWSALAFGLCAAFAGWLLLLGGILDASDMFIWPDVQTKSGRNLLMLFGFLSGTLSALVTAGVARAVKGRGKA